MHTQPMTNAQMPDSLGFVDLVALFVKRWRLVRDVFLLMVLVLGIAVALLPKKYMAMGVLQTGYVILQTVYTISDIPTMRADEYAAWVRGQYDVYNEARSLPRVEGVAQVGSGPKVTLVEVLFAAGDPQSGHVYAQQTLTAMLSYLQEIHQRELQRLTANLQALEEQVRMYNEQLAHLEATMGRQSPAQRGTEALVLSQMAAIREARYNVMTQLSEIRQAHEFVQSRPPMLVYAPSAGAFKQKPSLKMLVFVVLLGSFSLAILAVILVEFVQRVKFVLAQQIS